MASAYAAGAGSDYLQEMIRQKALEVYQNGLIKNEQDRIAQAAQIAAANQAMAQQRFQQDQAELGFRQSRAGVEDQRYAAGEGLRAMNLRMATAQAANVEGADARAQAQRDFTAGENEKNRKNALRIANIRIAASSPAGGPIPTGGNSAVTGEAALQGLDPETADLVKRIADYKFVMPTGTALRDKQLQRAITLASSYDPSFDPTQYANRQKLRGDFTSGKSAQNVRSLNTAVAHLGKLNEAGTALQNTSFPLWNTVANAAAEATGDPRIANFKTAATAVAGELANVFKNTGGTDQEINKWMANIHASQSPAQIKGTIQTAVDLLGGRLKALQDQYATGMGKPANFHLLSNESRKVLGDMGVDVDALDSGAGTSQAGKSGFKVVEIK